VDWLQAGGADRRPAGDVLTGHDELEASRAAFEAKIRANRPPTAPTSATAGGKGSPPALLAIGTIGTVLLGACAAALGGGLLFVPAAVPLATVLLVLLSRRLARRPAPRSGS
jgi:hypothetical protein